MALSDAPLPRKNHLYLKTNKIYAPSRQHNTLAAVKLTASIVEKFIPPRAQNSRKGDNGKILILGGSYVYHGAPILASLAALRCGTDLVYTAVPKINSQATRAASPNLIVIPLADQKLTRGAAKKLLGQTPVGLDSAAIGMGLAVQERNSLLMLIKTLLDSDVRLLLDASALVPEVLPEISGKNCILSPHTGEYKRLFGHAVPDDDASREREVEKMAAEHKVVIILKGATDIISDGETTYTNPKNSIYDSWGNSCQTYLSLFVTSLLPYFLPTASLCFMMPMCVCKLSDFCSFTSHFFPEL